MTAIRVPDTFVGLQQLAAAARQRFTGPVGAITGSVGKTTTKAKAAAVLAATHQPYANEASFNNHIGVPLTLLGVDEDHTHAVSEIGTNHRGEIAAPAGLVDPDLAVVTTSGYAHLGNFASREELSVEKADLFWSVRPGGHRIINVAADHGHAPPRPTGRPTDQKNPAPNVQHSEAAKADSVSKRTATAG